MYYRLKGATSEIIIYNMSASISVSVSGSVSCIISPYHYTSPTSSEITHVSHMQIHISIRITFCSCSLRTCRIAFYCVCVLLFNLPLARFPPPAAFSLRFKLTCCFWVFPHCSVRGWFLALLHTYTIEHGSIRHAHFRVRTRGTPRCRCHWKVLSSCYNVSRLF